MFTCLGSMVLEYGMVHIRTYISMQAFAIVDIGECTEILCVYACRRAFRFGGIFS